MRGAMVAEDAVELAEAGAPALAQMEEWIMIIADPAAAIDDQAWAVYKILRRMGIGSRPAVRDIHRQCDTGVGFQRRPMDFHVCA